MTFNLVRVYIDPDAGNPDSSFPQNRRVRSLFDSKHQLSSFTVNTFTASGRKNCVFSSHVNNQNQNIILCIQMANAIEKFVVAETGNVGDSSSLLKNGPNGVGQSPRSILPHVCKAVH
jgi:hypothetical protein